ncbi:BTAD domain-containing putative transcriptional regulator [Nonomuraea sp. NPDC050328]|uniref:AfsR/SARP family transcriptional regulator n=1 Tax=Nonomuraea sp. NPDC050328 TaxID=3364361 RepID=UPI00378DD4BE
MRFKVLGPLVVERDGEELRTGGSLQRVVLALLLLDAGRIVPLDRLIEATWGEEPPSTARNQIQIRISQLRRMLGDAAQPYRLLLTRPPGYQLRLEPGALDLAEFDALVARAQGEEPVRAVACLREALALWRGPALADVESELIRRIGQDLEERRILAHERCVDLELGLGRHQQLVAELRTAVQEHPLRERPHGQLMLALYRSGRHAEALEVYRAIRDTLRENLGLEPSDELRRMELAILNQEPRLEGPAPRPSVPRQLPPLLSALAGRQAELDRVELLLRPDEAGGGLPVAALTGRAGVGKTELALHAAHRLAPAYPDGQLYVDLRGGQLQPADVLSRFLRALGVGAAPTTLDERSALFRSTVAERQLLIVLDNAAGFDQVWPLLPGGPPSGVLITSRERLVGLAEGQVVRVGLLDHDSAVEVLAQEIGLERAAGEPEEVAVLAEQCGGLPLALRIAGGRLAVRPRWRVRTLVELLGDSRTMLDVLRQGDRAVRASLDVSYRGLSAPAQALFRAIGLLDFPQVPGWLAEALLGAEPGAALGELVEAALLRHSAGRYGMHDLVRAFAGERARAEEDEPARAATVHRAGLILLALAERAHEERYGDSHRLPRGSAPRVELPADLARHALAGLDDERVTLLAAVRQAAAHGLAELCWSITMAAVALYENYGYFEDWRTAARTALEACVSAGDVRGEAAMRYALSTVQVFAQRYGEAGELLESAIVLFSHAGERHGLGLALRNLAQVESFRGDDRRALERYRQALPLLHEAGDRPAEAHAMVNMAGLQDAGGDPGGAEALLGKALEIFRTEGVRRGEAQALDSLARLLLRQGRAEESQRAFESAAAIVRDIGDRIGEVYVMQGLAEAWRALDRPEEAERTLVEVLAVAEPLGDRLITGRIHLSLGSLLGSAEHLEHARGMFAEIGAESLRARAEEALARLP